MRGPWALPCFARYSHHAERVLLTFLRRLLQLGMKEWDAAPAVGKVACLVRTKSVAGALL